MTKAKSNSIHANTNKAAKSDGQVFVSENKQTLTIGGGQGETGLVKKLKNKTPI